MIEAGHPHPETKAGRSGGTSPLRSAFRHATAERHERLDRRFEGMTDAATPRLYHRFIRMNHACHKVLEPLLAQVLDAEQRAGFPWRRNLLPELEADMATMGLSPLEAPLFTISSPRIPEAVGLLYVLEGSRLGARYIHRAFQANEAASRWPGVSTHYLESAAMSGHFSALVDAMSAQLRSASDRDRALDAASATFSLFESAAEAAGKTGSQAADDRP